MTFTREEFLGTDTASFAKRLRMLKAIKGLSSRELAKRAGLTDQRLSIYMQGRRRPSRIEVLNGLAAACGVSVDALISGKGFIEIITGEQQ